MKKLMTLLLAISMVFCFVACGGGEDEPETEKTTEKTTEAAPEKVSGETYNAGNVSALVPDGWMAFPVNDMWSDDGNATDPDQMNIVKDGESEFDLLTKPYIQIVHYEPGEMMVPSKEYYDSAADVPSVTTGDLTWEGFSAVGMLEDSFIIMWTTNADGHHFQINVYNETDAGSIALTDADVLAILASITNS